MDWQALLVTLVIAAGMFGVIYVLIKKQVPFLQEILRDMSAVSRFFINTMVHDEEMKKKLLKWADKIPIIWAEVEVAKKRIQAQMLADGKDPDDVLEYQAMLIRESMIIAKQVAKDFGYEADEKVLYWIGEALSYLSLFFRKPNNGSLQNDSGAVILNVRDVPPQGSTDTTD